MDGLGRLITKARFIQIGKLWMSVNRRTTLPPKRLQPLNVGAFRLLLCCTFNPNLPSRREQSLFYAHLDYVAVPQLPINSHGNCERCHKASVALPCGTERRTTLQGKVMSRSGTILSIGFEGHSKLVTLLWRLKQGMPAASER